MAARLKPFYMRKVENGFFYFIMNFSYFPLREFTQALGITSKVKVRLVPFVSQIQKNNVEWMFHMFSEIYVYTVTPDADINFKFNSLVALKLLLDTCEFSVLLITEVYFLSHIRKVSTYQLHLQEKQRGLDFFTTQGYLKSQQNRKLGYNYVRLACEIITMLSVIKPHRLYRSQQLSESSQFANTLDIMRAQQWKEYDSLAFYSQNSIKLREHYLNKLEEFQDKSHYYYNFFETFLDKLLRKEYSLKGLDPRKILQSSQVYSCNFVLEVLKQMILEKKATTLINVLKLMTDFIRWGYIQAFYLIEIQRIFDYLLAEVKNELCKVKSLERGRHLFKDLEATEEEKKALYCELMKSIQIWAVCIPKNLINQSSQSRCSTIYKELISEFGLQFPPPGNIKKTKNECNQNLERNKAINRLLMKELQNSDFQLLQMKRTSSQLRELIKMDSNLLASLKTIISDSKLICRRKIGHHTKDHDEDSDSYKERQRVGKKTFTPVQENSQSQKINYLDTFCCQRNLNKNRHRTGVSYLNQEKQAINESQKSVASDRYYNSNSIRLTTLPSQEEPSQTDESSLEEEIIDEEQTDYSEEYEQNSEVKQLKVLKSDIGFQELKCKWIKRDSQKKIQRFPKIQTIQRKITQESSKIEFFEESFSSTSSFKSNDNNFDSESLNPKITINSITHHHIRDNKDDCSTTFKELDNNVEQYKVKSVKFFKKTPTVRQYQELEAKVQNLQVEKKQLKSELQNKNRELERLNKVKASCTSLRNTSQFSWSEYLFEETLTKKQQPKSTKQSRGSKQSSYIKGSRFFNQHENFNLVGIKKLLKSKDLLLRNQRLQIGFTFVKEEFSYQLSLFITPEKSMTKMIWMVEEDQCIQAYLQSEKFDSIDRRRQKKILYQFQINSPYKLPYFTLIYEMDNNQYQEKIILPVSFNKFVQFRAGQLQIQGSSLRRKTNIDMINKKYFKHISNFREYFIGLQIGEEQKQERLIKGVAVFENQEMNIKIILQGDFFQIECQIDRHDKPLLEKTEFLMMTMLNLIRK